MPLLESLSRFKEIGSELLSVLGPFFIALMCVMLYCEYRREKER